MSRSFPLLRPRHGLIGPLVLIGLTLITAWSQTPYVSLGAFAGPGRVCPRIVSLIQEEGGNIDWGPKGWMVYDCFDLLTKHYKVCLLLPDGNKGGSITNYRGPLAQADVGDPAWYPNGQWVVVQANDAPAPGWAVENPAFYRRISRPSVGYNNNLWLLAADGTNAYRLTNVRQGSGAVHPRFSHRGDYLAWSELVSLQPQKWVMRVAAFHLDKNGPHLGTISTLDPFHAPFYETSDFSPDDRYLVFSTTATPGDYQHLAIARFDLSNGTASFLTDPAANSRNQYARYSPNGKKIIWASSEDVPARTDFPLIGSEYWMMNADGSEPRRLTFFNQPDAPEYRISANIASNLSWNPDGTSIVGNVHFRTPSDPADDYISSILLLTLP